MPTDSQTTGNDELLTYMVASGDMRFIEIGERSLFLRHDPQQGRLIRGEVPECGPACFANLSEILLEYVMGCEDCREAQRSAVAADDFGRRLGRELINVFLPDPSIEPNIEALSTALSVVFNSMKAPFEFERTSNVVRFALAHCPLHDTAGKAGLTIWVPLAHRALMALIDTLIAGMAPGWARQAPAGLESEEPIQKVVIAEI